MYLLEVSLDQRLLSAAAEVEWSNGSDHCEECDSGVISVNIFI